MREIKFKGWNGKRFTREYTLGEMLVEKLDNNGLTENWLQFTGLLDKNGNEIYEGDIVDSDGTTLVVDYGLQEVDAFEGIGWNLWSFMGNNGCDGKRLSSQIEVIGNIYENPELLK